MLTQGKNRVGLIKNYGILLKINRGILLTRNWLRIQFFKLIY